MSKKLVREKCAKAPCSLAMEEMLNKIIKQIIDFRMLDYKEMVDKNNPSEEERVEALCSVAAAVIDIAAHIKDKMPNIEYVFNEKGEIITKNIWLGKNNDSTED